jgi:mono/diheme cytochrome c family protein
MRNKRFYGLALSFGLALVSVALAQVKTAPMTPQVERGKEFFLHTTKGTACGTCHQIGGVGTPIGPDLKKLASVVGPRGLVSTIQMSMTAYVQEYKIKDLGTFPGIQKEGSGGSQIYDLSKNPPELHDIKAGDISSQKQNEKWAHPPAKANYTPQELADVIAWLKYAATGNAKEVKASDVE